MGSAPPGLHLSPGARLGQRVESLRRTDVRHISMAHGDESWLPPLGGDRFFQGKGPLPPTLGRLLSSQRGSRSAHRQSL